jgi:hypothetical protein
MALNTTDRSTTNPIVLAIIAVVAIGVIWFLVSMFTSTTPTTGTGPAPSTTTPAPTAPK